VKYNFPYHEIRF